MVVISRLFIFWIAYGRLVLAKVDRPIVLGFCF